MTVIDAKHFREQLSEKSVQQEAALDEWLDKVVLNEALKYGDLKDRGFSTPAGIDDLTNRLERRGFVVNTYNSFQGSFVYLSLPEDV